MRALFSCNPELGHVHPVLPLARAVRDRGHRVAFLSGPDVRDAIVDEGFEFLCCGPDFGSLVGEALIRYPDSPLESPEDQQRFGFGRLFSATRVALTADDATEAARSFRPDIVVNEVADFVGPLVAARLGRPNATLGIGLVLADEWVRLAAQGVASVWTECGLDPRDDAGIYRTLYINQWPRTLQRPLQNIACEVRDLRPVVFGEDAQLPPDLEFLGDGRPVVYVTFGTMFGEVPMLRTVVEGLLELGEEVRIVATVGFGIDPASVDLDRENLVVRQFIPQGALLARCRLAVNHGGSGSVLGPLRYGVPLLVIPMGADQLENADRVAASRVGRVIQPATLTSDLVRDTARALLRDDDIRANVAALNDEIAAMPTQLDLLPILEQLAADA